MERLQEMIALALAFLGTGLLIMAAIAVPLAIAFAIVCFGIWLVK